MANANFIFDKLKGKEIRQLILVFSFIGKQTNKDLLHRNSVHT